MLKRLCSSILVALSLCGLVSCRGDSWPPARLSAYGLFLGNGSTQEPRPGVVPYDVNTPLFSDYSTKYRFVRVPAGEGIDYRPAGVLDFPVGTVLAKTFAYPTESRAAAPGLLIETRILERRPEGWVGLPYLWNDSQTEATLAITGGRREVEWIDEQGARRRHTHLVPNANQCKGCHRVTGREMSPIGPQVRQLNRAYEYPAPHGGQRNQLDYWTEEGFLRGAPPAGEAPRLAVWDDPATGTLDQRARAWLDVNCAHCHNPGGPARSSGLDLRIQQSNPTSIGVHKAPVAAGRGTGGRHFGIVPGHPEESILVYRLESQDPGVMMPELGRSLVHREGLELIRRWIRAMPKPSQP